MIDALSHHWPEYCIEAALLGLFMLSACGVVTLFHHPASPFTRRLRDGAGKRALVGIAMGATAIVLITSPLGRRSGAHMNPSVTLTQLALGRVAPWDAAFYIVAQFVGGIAGVRFAAALLGGRTRHEAVRHAATVPGSRGPRAAWLAEFAIAFMLMLMALVTSNHSATAALTPYLAGALIAAFITFEAPYSGMSMNPARTLASAAAARMWRALWVYFTAPPLAMLAAGVVYAAAAGPHAVYCAKFDHRGDARCIFRCRIDELPGRHASPGRPVGIQHNASAAAPSEPEP